MAHLIWDASRKRPKFAAGSSQYTGTYGLEHRYTGINWLWMWKWPSIGGFGCDCRKRTWRCGHTSKLQLAFNLCMAYVCMAKCLELIHHLTSSVVHSLVLRKPALRRTICLMAIVTFIVLAIRMFEAPLEANCHHHAWVWLIWLQPGTALHNPMQYSASREQEHRNPFVLWACTH